MILGGILPKGHIQSGDANDILSSGVYSVNIPDPGQYNFPTRWGTLISLNIGNTNGNTNIQFMYESNSDVIYVRAKSLVNGWAIWRKIADFPTFYKDYNSLAELKAALAAI